MGGSREGVGVVVGGLVGRREVRVWVVRRGWAFWVDGLCEVVRWGAVRLVGVVVERANLRVGFVAAWKMLW